MKTMIVSLVWKRSGIAFLVAFGFGLMSPVSVTAGPFDLFNRGPYLQLSSSTNITICWRTFVPIPGHVYYGTNPAALTLTNLGLNFEENHFVTLSNLQPDTKYYYAVGTDIEHAGGAEDGILAGPGPSYHFRTHPLPGTEKPTGSGLISSRMPLATRPWVTVEPFIRWLDVPERSLVDC